MFFPGESQGWGSLEGGHLWGRTESDTTEATLHMYSHFSERNLLLVIESTEGEMDWRGEKFLPFIVSLVLPNLIWFSK